jgi:hypothetical protein
VLHPNLLRPFPKAEWAKLIAGKHVFVYDRDDPFGAVGGRLYTELAGVANEYDLAASGTRLYSRIYASAGARLRWPWRATRCSRRCASRRARSISRARRLMWGVNL